MSEKLGAGDTKRVHFLMTESELQGAKDAAAEAGVKLSEWLREAIRLRVRAAQDSA